MIIGIDGNEANVKELVGVSVYTLRLLESFQKRLNENLKFRVYLREKPQKHLPVESVNYTYTIVKPNFLWSQISLPIYLTAHEKPAVFFSPAHYAPRFCPVPTVVTIHDLSYFYFPNEFLKNDLYKLINWTKYSVRKAKKIIAVSEHTKKDLVNFYNVAEEKISVVYNGYGIETQNLKLKNQNSINYKLKTKNYILYVGTVQPRKNIKTLIDAFDIFTDDHPDFSLYIVGKKGWMYDKTAQSFKQSNHKDKIIMRGYVSDDELALLYQNAFCLVNPSLYEGFGIPVLEAMSQSCPVIASNTSSLPEIGGDAALYFDPKSIVQLGGQLNKLYDDKKLRDELVKRGKERIKKFSWQTCADKTLAILHEAYK